MTKLSIIFFESIKSSVMNLFTVSFLGSYLHSLVESGANVDKINNVWYG